MKKHHPFGIFLFLAVVSIHAQDGEFPKLTGPYLGQKPPGKMPEQFAASIPELQDLHGMVTFSPEGNEAFWKPFWRPVEPILFSKLESGQWTKPRTAPFSAANQGDDSPFLSPDGKKLFFISQRPISGREQDPKKERIWVTERISAGWAEPKPLTEAINSLKGIHWQMSVDNQGHLYFGGEGNGRTGDIFCSRFEGGIYAVPQKLGPAINKAGDFNYSPYIFPDGRTLLFARNQNPGHIFASFRKKDGSWTEAEDIGRFLSSQSCLNPRGTADGRYLFFYAKGGITCWVDAGFIEELRKKELHED